MLTIKAAVEKAVQDQSQYMNLVQQSMKKDDVSEALNISALLKVHLESSTIVINNLKKVAEIGSIEFSDNTEEIELNVEQGGVLEVVQGLITNLVRLNKMTYKPLLQSPYDEETGGSISLPLDVALFSFKWAKKSNKTMISTLKKVCRDLKKGEDMIPIGSDEGIIFNICRACGNILLGTPERMCPVCDNEPFMYKKITEEK